MKSKKKKIMFACLLVNFLMHVLMHIFNACVDVFSIH